MFYHKIVGDEIKMTAGDGFGIMIIHIFHYFWIIIGTITAFIVTAMNQRRANQNKQEAKILKRGRFISASYPFSTD